MLSGLVLIAGFVRELIVAAHYGLSRELDVFVAMMGFLLLFGVQAGNALDNAFVSKLAKHGSATNVQEGIRSVLGKLISVNVVGGDILVLISPSLLDWIFPGFSPQQDLLAQKILYPLLIAILLANMGGLFRGGLNVLRDFSPGLVAGAIISLSSITAMLLFSGVAGIFALVYGVVAGHAAVLIFYGWRLSRKGSLPSLSRSSTNTVVSHEIMGATGIILVSEFLYQAYAMTERSFGSTLGTGTISSFYFASSLVLVPAALVLTPITTVVFPRLTKEFSIRRNDGVRTLLIYGGLLLSFAIVATILAHSFALEIVKIVFQRGNFSSDNAERTATIFMITVLVLPAISVDRLFRYSLYALGNFRAPIISNAIQWGTLVLSALVLIPLFDVRGLAIASVACQYCSTTALGIILLSKLRHEKSPRA
jgi:putative peptidoglycan lipid II flippase